MSDFSENTSFWTDLPDLNRETLQDWGGGFALREAKSWVQSGGVKNLCWEHPRLTGEVHTGNGEVYEVSLNIRNLTFVENRCGCLKGRQGYVCTHALALCLAANQRQTEALEQQARRTRAPVHPSHADPAAKPDAASSTSSPASEVPASLRSLQIAPGGTRLHPWFLLPPNCAQALQRNAIILKLELASDQHRAVPEKFFRGKRYSLRTVHETALCCIENWCGGKLAGFLQLDNQRLHLLLGILQGEPVFAWSNQPRQPIAWEGSQLPGLSELLEKALQAPQSTASRLPPLALPAAPPATPRTQSPRSLPPLADPMQSLFRETSADPADRRRRPETRLPKVDGSAHYLAITPPLREDPLYQPLIELLKANDFKAEPSNGKFWLRDRHKTLNFLAAHRKVLSDQFKAFFTEGFQQRTAHLQPAQIRAVAEETTGAFIARLEIQAGGADEASLRSALLSGHQYIEQDGKIFLIDPVQIERMENIQRALSGDPSRPLTVNFRQPLRPASLRDAEELLEALDPAFRPPETWSSRSAALKSISGLQPAPLPPDFDQHLRSYQRVGVAWLWHLAQNELGGILADEMGLGKTIQALGLIACTLQNRKIAVPRSPNLSPGAPAPSDNDTALIVCPATLLQNWQREAHRWLPKARSFVHHRENRLSAPVDFARYDLVITSYSTLNLDNELFLAAGSFALIIADEAQHIKNARSQSASALRSLRASARFVLTGTPIENSVDDLRSLFRFLMPGYLAACPSGMRGDERQWFDQRNLTQAAPYVLRRAKKDVAAELPEKIEQTLFCTMSAAQRNLYDTLRLRGESELADMESRGLGENKMRFAALTQLLRLRQVCAEPRLLDESLAPVHSTKLAAFEEILEEAEDGGHRILLFSQFTGVLAFLRHYLEERQTPYAYLDGSTRNRMAEVDRFNRDASIPVFLISLKAGGTGLNLTGADTVVHFDPWWNPAAEAQATDRAHRIGQTRTVSVYRLIAEDSVEEKVLELQTQKAAILRDLLDESAAATAKVSLHEIRQLLRSG